MTNQPIHSDCFAFCILVVDLLDNKEIMTTIPPAISIIIYLRNQIILFLGDTTQAIAIAATVVVPIPKRIYYLYKVKVI